MECPSFYFFGRETLPPSFSLVPHPSLVLGYIGGNSFQSFKKILSAHSLSGIFFFLLPEAVPMYFVCVCGGGVSSQGQEMAKLVLLGGSPEITFKSPF